MSLMKHTPTVCTVKRNNYLLYTYLSGTKEGKQITHNYITLLFSVSYPVLEGFKRYSHTDGGSFKFFVTTALSYNPVTC
jgi:hypothetical protein